MQKNLLMALAIGTLSTTAIADETSMNSLSYRVKANEFHYELGMDFGKSEFLDTETAVGATTSNNNGYEVKSTKWTNDFSYGITDSFSVGLGLDLVLSSKLTQVSKNNAGASAAFDSQAEKNDGLGDIRLNTSYRYMDGAVKADLLAGVAISGKGKKASRYVNATTGKNSVSEGNAKSGGSSLQLATQFSGAMDKVEWAAVVAADYKMKAKNTMVNGDETTTANTDYEVVSKSKLDLALGVTGQYNVTSAVSVGANLLANFVSKDEGTASVFAGNATTTNVTKNTESYTDLTLGAEVKYQVMSNVALGLNYSHLFGADLKATQVENDSGTITRYALATKDRKDDSFGFDIQVRF